MKLKQIITLSVLSASLVGIIGCSDSQNSLSSDKYSSNSKTNYNPNTSTNKIILYDRNDESPFPNDKKGF